MLVSPMLNDLLVLADVEPSTFLRSYRGAFATEGRWSSTTGSDFARVGDVVVRAGPYGTALIGLRTGRARYGLPAEGPQPQPVVGGSRGRIEADSAVDDGGDGAEQASRNAEFRSS